MTFRIVCLVFMVLFYAVAVWLATEPDDIRTYAFTSGALMSLAIADWINDVIDRRTNK